MKAPIIKVGNLEIMGWNNMAWVLRTTCHNELMSKNGRIVVFQHEFELKWFLCGKNKNGEFTLKDWKPEDIKSVDLESEVSRVHCRMGKTQPQGEDFIMYFCGEYMDLLAYVSAMAAYIDKQEWYDLTWKERKTK